MTRTKGSVFITKIFGFRGQAKKQATNARGEILAIINEEMRNDIAEGDTVICRVEERSYWKRDEDGEVENDAQGNPIIAGTELRNEVIAFGTAAEMAKKFHADAILEAEAEDIIQEEILAAREARKRPVAQAQAQKAATEPIVG